MLLYLSIALWIARYKRSLLSKCLLHSTPFYEGKCFHRVNKNSNMYLYLGCVCCWFSPLLRGFFSGFSGFPPSTKTTTFPNSSSTRIDDPHEKKSSSWCGFLSTYCNLLFIIFLLCRFSISSLTPSPWFSSEGSRPTYWWKTKKNSRLRLSNVTSRCKFHILVRCGKLSLFVKWYQRCNFTWEVCLFLRWISQTRRRLERHECHLQVSKNREKVENKCRSITTIDEYVRSMANSTNCLAIIP